MMMDLGKAKEREAREKGGRSFRVCEIRSSKKIRYKGFIHLRK